MTLLKKKKIPFPHRKWSWAFWVIMSNILDLAQIDQDALGSMRLNGPFFFFSLVKATRVYFPKAPCIFLIYAGHFSNKRIRFAKLFLSRQKRIASFLSSQASKRPLFFLFWRTLQLIGYLVPSVLVGKEMQKCLRFCFRRCLFS